MVGPSDAWQAVLKAATQVASTDSVLLVGESGTGMEVVARFIHHASNRADGPFVALDCAALREVTHRDLRGQSDAHPCCGKSSIESAVVRVAVRNERHRN